jgi:DNA polymerase-3 subunit delta'
MLLSAGVIITQQPKEVLSKLKELKSNEQFTIIDSNEKEFLLEHATEAIAKAFISSDVTNFIILIAPRFSVIAQNRLLKILEEPPRDKEFILITKSKSSILPTIKSRMPITIIKDDLEVDDLELDILNLNLAKVYEFSQKNSRISSKECKELIEKIAIGVIKSEKYNINSSLLETFSNSIKALEVGSPSSFILNGLLIRLLARKNDL